MLLARHVQTNDATNGRARAQPAGLVVFWHSSRGRWLGRAAVSAGEVRPVAVVHWCVR